MRDSLDQMIETGWRRGDTLADIALRAAPALDVDEERCASRQVMDRVRALGLPDRDPATRKVIENSAVAPAWVGKPRAPAVGAPP